MTTLLLALIYLAFISLGLPDSLLGAVWPTLQPEFGVPLSYAGLVSAIICCGTVISSFMSDRLTRRFGAGKVTACSVGATALALWGFSMSHHFLTLCLWAIPYGLGAGGVDAALNNYVALHYSSRHMSWLHCMWGIGTAVGATVLGRVLTATGEWNTGYRYVAWFQVFVTLVLLLSLPLWKHRETEGKDAGRALTFREVLTIPGAKEVMLMFFCYCTVEQTAILWGSSYLVAHGITTDTAATLASLFCIGITVGRGVNGFLTLRFDDDTLIRAGCVMIAAGIAAMGLPLPLLCHMAGLVMVGLGCAPIYPCIIHSTPAHFGEENSQAIIGMQMGSAYIGTLVMPPLFGLIAGRTSSKLLPAYLLLALLVTVILHRRMMRKTAK